MKILVLGTTGQLGWQLMRDLGGSPPRGSSEGEEVPVRVQLLGTTRAQLDVGHESRAAIEASLAALLDQHQPDLVINAIAYTAVDRAESEPELAAQVNGWFPGLLGRSTRGAPGNTSGTRVVHFSSDYVFDGRSNAPYRESDSPAPLGVYGATKREGESALLEANSRALVLRCSWVVGAHGQNFARTILRLACERDRLRVVSDQWGVPTPTRFIVEQLRRVIFPKAAGAARAGVDGAPAGLFHLVPSGETSWHGYASWLLEQAREHPGWRGRLRVRADRLEAISSAEYPTAAPRPPNSRLDTQKWRGLTRVEALEDWRSALGGPLENMLSGWPA